MSAVRLLDLVLDLWWVIVVENGRTVAEAGGAKRHFLRRGRAMRSGRCCDILASLGVVEAGEL
jgi:hypothetical protein